MSEVAYRVGRSKTGLGLFATRLIKKGEFIVEYDGLRITNEEVERRSNTRYLFTVNSTLTVDGSPRWNKARYINHSCRANSDALIWRHRIRIKAGKRIRPGDEITIHYGKEYFEELIAPVGCKCPKCAPVDRG